MDGFVTSSNINWKFINSLDVSSDMVNEENVLEVLKQISRFFNCHMNAIMLNTDIKVLDASFLKLFKLSYATLEFLLRYKMQLEMENKQLFKYRQESEKLGKECFTRKLENKRLKKQLQEFNRTNALYANVITAECHVCKKIFVNVMYLYAHHIRRHRTMPFVYNEPLDKENGMDALRTEVNNLKDKISTVTTKQTHDQYVQVDLKPEKYIGLEKLSKGENGTAEISLQFINNVGSGYLKAQEKYWRGKLAQENETRENEITRLKNLLDDLENENTTLKEQLYITIQKMELADVAIQCNLDYQITSIQSKNEVNLVKTQDIDFDSSMAVLEKEDDSLTDSGQLSIQSDVINVHQTAVSNNNDPVVSSESDSSATLTDRFGKDRKMLSTIKHRKAIFASNVWATDSVDMILKSKLPRNQFTKISFDNKKFDKIANQTIDLSLENKVLGVYEPSVLNRNVKDTNELSSQLASTLETSIEEFLTLESNTQQNSISHSNLAPVSNSKDENGEYIQNDNSEFETDNNSQLCINDCEKISDFPFHNSSSIEDDSRNIIQITAVIEQQPLQKNIHQVENQISPIEQIEPNKNKIEPNRNVSIVDDAKDQRNSVGMILNQKLQSIGLDPNQKCISNDVFRSKMSILKHRQNVSARDIKRYFYLRKKCINMLENKYKERTSIKVMLDFPVLVNNPTNKKLRSDLFNELIDAEDVLIKSTPSVESSVTEFHQSSNFINSEIDKGESYSSVDDLLSTSDDALSIEGAESSLLLDTIEKKKVQQSLTSSLKRSSSVGNIVKRVTFAEDLISPPSRTVVRNLVFSEPVNVNRQLEMKNSVPISRTTIIPSLHATETYELDFDLEEIEENMK